MTRTLAALGVALLPMAGLAARQSAPPAQADAHEEHAAHAATASAHAFTLNLHISDAGVEPSSVFVPAERRVQLVLRTRDATEHHYRVVGLMARDLLWISEPGTTMEPGALDEDHAFHHDRSFVGWRDPSPSGIRPTGTEVHAYVSPARGVDVLQFTPTSTGAFDVRCDLHEKTIGKVTVFATEDQEERIERLLPWGVR